MAASSGCKYGRAGSEKRPTSPPARISRRMASGSPGLPSSQFRRWIAHSSSSPAARLEALAEPGGICVSGAVRDHIGTKLPVGFIDLGPQQVKNIAQPIKAYRITDETSPTDTRLSVLICYYPTSLRSQCFRLPI